jgi:hypothetical protein
MAIYDEIKPQVSTELVADYKRVSRKLNRFKEHLAGRESRIASLKEENTSLGRRLVETTDDSDRRSFEKYENSIRKNKAEIDSLESSASLFESDIIPGAEKEVIAAANRLKQNVYEICRAKAAMVSAQMNGLLSQVVELFDDNYNSARQLYGDFGFTVGPYVSDWYAEPRHQRLDIRFLPGNFEPVMASQQVIKPFKAAAPVVEPLPLEKLVTVPSDEQIKEDAEKWAGDVFTPAPIVNTDEDGEVEPEKG